MPNALDLLEPSLRMYLPSLQARSQYAEKQVLSGADISPADFEFNSEILRQVGAQWLVPGVLLSLQYLSTAGVEYVNSVGDTLTYCANGEEDAPYQIPEAQLHLQDMPLAAKLIALHDVCLAHVWALAFGMRPELHRSVQIAKYEAGHKGSSWHYDQDSECTTTVSLNSDYIGGGMRVFTSDVLWKSGPGEAFLFKGSTTLHRSELVTAGARKVLVHWVDRG